MADAMAMFHELANAFPLISGEAFDELVEDIKVHGLNDPIVMFEGKILDGRNRWRACQHLGIPHTEVKLEDLAKRQHRDVDPVAFVWSKNAVRRQLSPSQRAMAATKLLNTKQGDNRHTTDTKTTAEKAAALAGVGKRSVLRAKRVTDQGTPAVIAAVEAGELTLEPAEVIAAKPAETQDRIMAGGAEEATKVVSLDRARRKAADKSAATAPGRGGVGPKVTMTRQMEGSSAEGSKSRTRFWTENSALIKDLDPELLDQFVTDLTEDRRAMEQLLRLIKTERLPKAPAAKKTAAKKAAGTTTAAGAKTAKGTPGSPAAKKAAAPRTRAPRKTTAAKTTAAAPAAATEKNDQEK